MSQQLVILIKMMTLCYVKNILCYTRFMLMSCYDYVMLNLCLHWCNRQEVMIQQVIIQKIIKFMCRPTTCNLQIFHFYNKNVYIYFIKPIIVSIRGPIIYKSFIGPLNQMMKAVMGCHLKVRYDLMVGNFI